MDQEIVWYGNMNLLVKKRDSNGQEFWDKADEQTTADYLSRMHQKRDDLSFAKNNGGYFAEIVSAYQNGQTTAQNYGNFVITNTNSNSGGNGGNGSNSGNGSNNKDDPDTQKYNNELKRIQHLKNMDEMYIDEEIKAYENMLKTYTLTAEQRENIEEKLHAALKKLNEDEKKASSEKLNKELSDIEHKRNLDKLTTDEEISRLQNILKTYKLTTEEREKVQEKLYAAQKRSDEEDKKAKEEQQKHNSEILNEELEQIAHKKALNQLSSEDEIAWYDKILAEFAMTEKERQKIIETRASVYNQFYKKQLEEEKKLYQERLNLALAAYNRLVDGKIENYKKEADAAKKTADAEIKAINDAAKARKQDKDDREREKKIAALNAKLSYEHLDDFSRRELQKEIAEIQAEQDEVNLERDEEEQKTHWNDRATNAADFFQQAIDGLNAGKNLFSDRVAALLGNQSYDQRVANNTTTQNINIIQNNLSADQVVNKLLKELGVTK